MVFALAIVAVVVDSEMCSKFIVVLTVVVLLVIVAVVTVVVITVTAVLLLALLVLLLSLHCCFVVVIDISSSSKQLVTFRTATSSCDSRSYNHQTVASNLQMCSAQGNRSAKINIKHKHRLAIAKTAHKQNLQNKNIWFMQHSRTTAFIKQIIHELSQHCCSRGSPLHD